MKKKTVMQNSFASVETVTPLTQDEAEELCTRFGFASLRLHQSAAIAAMAAGCDLLLLAGTASGKTEATLGATLLHPERGLHVQIEPLKALQADMRDRMEKLGLQTIVLNSELSASVYAEALKQIQNHQVDCILTTPEQLEKRSVFKALNAAGVGTVVIDEVHCLLEYGGDFRPAYDRIGAFISHLDSRPVVAACTATLAPDSLQKVCKSLGLRHPVLYRGGVDRPEIHQNIIEIGIDLKHSDSDLIERERMRRLEKMLDKYIHKGDGAIVYCTTIRQTQDICKRLCKDGYDAESFYADLPAKQKEQIRKQFRDNKLPIVVATSAFGMGVDKPNIRLVVHMSLPLSVEDYWQKTGRAGRDGKKSFACTFWNRGDRNTNQRILSSSNKMKLHKFEQLWKFVQTSTCYVQQLRIYFGEKAGKPCGHCSICKMKR